MRHRFHALCPYFAMFPEEFARVWIERLTEPGDLVLDPFCGRGTAPFQALLMGREALASDTNPVAYCVTRAKTNAPAAASLRRRVTLLERAFDPAQSGDAVQVLPEFFSHAFAPETLRQLVFLRGQLAWQTGDVDCMLAALTLGSLHGETERSPSYLSAQMPRTISTKPKYSIRYWRRHGLKAPERDVFDLLRNRITYRYASTAPTGRATVLHADVRRLPFERARPSKMAKLVITSPPYLDVTNFEEDQWLRLWFLGGAPWPTRNRHSRDDRLYTLDAYWRMLADTWRSLGELVDTGSHVVMRVGFRDLAPERVAEGVVGTSILAGRRFELQGYSVSDLCRRQTPSFRPGSRGCLQEVDVLLRAA